jgi:hypothetical protein
MRKCEGVSLLISISSVHNAVLVFYLFYLPILMRYDLIRILEVAQRLVQCKYRTPKPLILSAYRIKLIFLRLCIVLDLFHLRICVFGPFELVI